MELSAQVIAMFVLAIPVATIARTVTHEEIFREAREYCSRKSENCRRLVQRKFFYVFTCEYCFSHYVTILLLFITGFRMIYDDWRGYVVSFFALVWVANIYMNLYSRLRVDIRSGRVEAELKEVAVQEKKADLESNSANGGSDSQTGDADPVEKPRAGDRE